MGSLSFLCGGIFVTSCLNVGDLFLCGLHGCFSNPMDSRKTRGEFVRLRPGYRSLTHFYPFLWLLQETIDDLFLGFGFR